MFRPHSYPQGPPHRECRHASVVDGGARGAFSATTTTTTTMSTKATTDVDVDSRRPWTASSVVLAMPSSAAHVVAFATEFQCMGGTTSDLSVLARRHAGTWRRHAHGVPWSAPTTPSASVSAADARARAAMLGAMPAILVSRPPPVEVLRVEGLKFATTVAFLQFQRALGLCAAASSGLDTSTAVSAVGTKLSRHHAQRGWRFVTHSTVDAERRGHMDCEVNPLNGLRGAEVDERGGLVLPTLEVVRDSPLVPLLDRVASLAERRMDVFGTLGTRGAWLDFFGYADRETPPHRAAAETVRWLVSEPGTVQSARFEGCAEFVVLARRLLDEWVERGAALFDERWFESHHDPPHHSSCHYDDDNVGGIAMEEATTAGAMTASPTMTTMWDDADDGRSDDGGVACEEDDESDE